MSKFNKIFCIGFNKTGTTSIAKLFRDSGITTTDGGVVWYYTYGIDENKSIYDTKGLDKWERW